MTQDKKVARFCQYGPGKTYGTECKGYAQKRSYFCMWHQPVPERINECVVALMGISNPQAFITTAKAIQKQSPSLWTAYERQIESEKKGE